MRAVPSVRLMPRQQRHMVLMIMSRLERLLPITPLLRRLRLLPTWITKLVMMKMMTRFVRTRTETETLLLVPLTPPPSRLLPLCQHLMRKKLRHRRLATGSGPGTRASLRQVAVSGKGLPRQVATSGKELPAATTKVEPSNGARGKPLLLQLNLVSAEMLLYTKLHLCPTLKRLPTFGTIRRLPPSSIGETLVPRALHLKTRIIHLFKPVPIPLFLTLPPLPVLLILPPLGHRPIQRLPRLADGQLLTMSFMPTDGLAPCPTSLNSTLSIASFWLSGNLAVELSTTFKHGRAGTKIIEGRLSRRIMMPVSLL